MAINKSIQPPPNILIPELLSPDHTYVLFRELVSRESPRFRQLDPIKRGTAYSEGQGADKKIIEVFPDLVFCKETVPSGSNTVAGMPQSDWVIWNWASGRDSESTFNAEISYLGDATGNPVYARVYTVKRDDYDAIPALATGSILTALTGVRMITGGQNYTHAHATFLGPGEDSGADIDFVIVDGRIDHGIVTAEGKDFDYTSVIEIIGDGTGATCVPLFQPPNAYLTSQRKVEFEESDPLSHEFVKVLRAYEVLPGPWIPFTRYDELLGPVQGRRRAVLNSGQLGGVITPISKDNYEGREGSSVVSLQIEENWSDGTGSDANNPTYPILIWDTYDDARGPVLHTRQLKVSDGFGDVASYEALSTPPLPQPRKVRRTWFEPYKDNPALVIAFIDTFFEEFRGDFKISSQFGGGVFAVEENRGKPGTLLLDYGKLVTDSFVQKLSPDEQLKHTEFFYGLPTGTETEYPILYGLHTDEKTGIRLPYSKQVVDFNDAAPPKSGYRGPFVEEQPYDRWRKIRIITTPDCTSLPQDEQWYTSRPFSLPPELLSIEAVWGAEVEKVARGRANTGDENATHVLVRSGSRGGVLFTARSGFRGRARTKVYRQYKCGPFTSNEIPNTFAILPSTGSVVFFESSSSSQASGSDDDSGPVANGANSISSTAGGLIGDSFEFRVHEHVVHEHLIGSGLSVLNPTQTRQWMSATAISGGGFVRNVTLIAGDENSPWNGRMEVRMPLSSPTPEYLRSIGEIVDEVVIEEWGFGIWVMEVYTIQLAGII